MNREDRLTSLVWLGAGILICFGSLRLSLGNIHHPGPGFFPFMTGGILSLLSFIIFFQSGGEGRGEKGRPGRSPQGRTRMIWVIITLVMYAVGMNYVGFFFSTLFFLASLLRWMGGQRWAVALAASGAGAVSFHLVFQYWLDVQMPRGIIGF